MTRGRAHHSATGPRRRAREHTQPRRRHRKQQRVVRPMRLPTIPRMQVIGGPPLFVLMWFSNTPFIYETSYGGAEKALAGRNAVRFSTKAQALALGRNLLKAQPSVTYSVYRLADGDMRLENSFPKKVNVEGARIKFRKRRPKTGGADDSLLGVGGMSDDVWRELLERDGWGSLDEAWSRFRREALELGRGLEVVDENGDPFDVGGYYPRDNEEEEYD